MDSVKLAWNIRRDAVEMTHVSNGSHIASVLSLADIVAVLYADIMVHDPGNPDMEDRDRFVLSKGHAGAAVYAALAETGYFPVDELLTHYANGSRLSGHVSHKGVPGVEFSTGSLGHGICVAAGMAMAAKLDGRAHRVYTIIGDGECDEGSVWETALQANHFRLGNLTVIVDANGMQSLARCEDTIDLLDLAAKWRAFGWKVREVDGHDHRQLREALSAPDDIKPTVVVAHTVKGKGISFMEHNILWHYRAPQGEVYDAAVAELEAARA